MRPAPRAPCTLPKWRLPALHALRCAALAGGKKKRPLDDAEDEEEEDGGDGDLVRYVLGTFVVELQGAIDEASFKCVRGR